MSGFSTSMACIIILIKQPPGARNWAVGCIGRPLRGARRPTPRPFAADPPLPEGTFDSPDKPVAPQSLYLAQLAERLGPQAVKNIGY